MFGFGNANPPNRSKGHIWHYEPETSQLISENTPITLPGPPNVSKDTYETYNTYETSTKPMSREISPPTDEYDEQTPIIGLSQGEKGDDWSEIPTCPFVECNNYRPPWPRCVAKLLHTGDTEKAAGFWMNLKKTGKGPHFPYVTLHDTIGDNEVLSKLQSPDPSDTPESPSEEATCEEKSVHPLVLDLQATIRSTPPTANNNNNRGMKIPTKSRREKRTKCSTSVNAPSTKRQQKTRTPRSRSPKRSSTPPYSPCTSLRELRPPSPPQNRTRPLRAPPGRSRARGVPQGSRVGRRASLLRFEATAQVLRPVSRPATAAATATNRHLPSQQQIRHQDPPKFNVRQVQSSRTPASQTRARSPTGNKNYALRSLTSITAGMSKISIQKVSKKPSGKKKRSNNTKATIRGKKSSSTSPQDSPLLPSPPYRNAGQQTDVRFSSISTQTALTSNVISKDQSSTTTIIDETSPPILMSRTAQTTPSSEAATREKKQVQTTDSDTSPMNSKSNICSSVKKTLNSTSPSTLKLTRVSWEKSTVAQEGKKLNARISTNSRVSLVARVSKSDTRANIAVKRGNVTQTNKANPNVFFRWEGQKSETSRRKGPLEKQETTIGKKVNEQPKGCVAKVSTYSPTKTVTKPTATKDNASKTSFSGNTDDIKAVASNMSQHHESSQTTEQEKTTCVVEDSEVNNKLSPILSRSGNKEKASDPRELVKKPKGMNVPIKDRILGRSNAAKPIIKYGTHLQPCPMTKNKSLSSLEVRSLFNRKRISKPMVSRESGSSSSKPGQTRETVVKKNLNMLIEACQNLLREAMKETGRKDSDDKIHNKKVGPSTRETVAWILQTLKSTYGNVEEVPTKINRVSNEQECQTSRNLILTPTTDRRSLNWMPSFDKSETIVSSQYSWPDLTISLNSADRSCCEAKSPERNSSREIFAKDCQTAPKDFTPSTLSMGDSFDNDMLHLNCGNFKVALRQVSAISSGSRLETVKEESCGSYTLDEVLMQSPDVCTDRSLDMGSESATNVVLVTPMTLPKSSVNPVTRVSIWSKCIPLNPTNADSCDDTSMPFFKTSNPIGDGDFSDAQEAVSPQDENARARYEDKKNYSRRLVR